MLRPTGLHCVIFSVGFSRMPSWACLSLRLPDHEAAPKQERQVWRNVIMPCHRGLLLLNDKATVALVPDAPLDKH